MHFFACFLQKKENEMANKNPQRKTKPKRLKQLYLNATARQARASTFFFDLLEKEDESMDAQGKRHNVWMSR